MAKKTNKAEQPETWITAYKAFDSDFSCRGFKYELGQTYEMDGPVELCERGFHAVTVPMDAWNYYPPSAPVARVRVANPIYASNDSKVVSAKITIEALLSPSDFASAQVNAVHAQGAHGHSIVQGDYGRAVAQGYCEHAIVQGDFGRAVAQGDEGHAIVQGRNSVAAALGIKGTAQAALGSWIVLAAYEPRHHILKLVKSFLVDGETVRADTPYRLRLDGSLEEIKQ